MAGWTRRVFVLGVGVVAVVIGMVVWNPFQASAQTPPAGALVVGTSGPDCTSPAYSTIQSAIDAASSGGTVYVCPGTYDESLTIDKPITLDGAEYDVDARGRGGASESIIDGPGGITYTAGASSGTVNGFTLEGYSGSAAEIDADQVGAGWSFKDDIIDVSQGGIYVNTDGQSNPAPSTIEYDLFIQSTPSAASTGHEGQAVIVADGTANNLTVAYNVMENLSGPGASVATPGTAACGATLDTTHFSTGLWVIENLETEDGASFTDPVNGPGFIDEPFIDLVCTSGAHVSEDTVTITDGADPHAATGIILGGGDWNAVLQSDVLNGDGATAATGIDVNALSYPAGTGIQLVSNAVTAYETGIDIRGGTGTTVSKNVVQNSGADGVEVASTSGGGNTLSQNTITGSVTDDCVDATTGTDTDGTADTWTENGGTTSSPAGLCSPFEAPTITSAATATATQGSSFTFTVTSTGYPTPTLSVGGLPAGLSFTAASNGTGTISGTPGTATSGVHDLKVKATNTTGTTQNVANQTLVLTVDKKPAITSADTDTVSPGTAFTFTVKTTAYPTASLSESGALPNGVTFTNNGTGTATLAGTPVAPLSSATWPITITATNTAGIATQAFTLDVEQAPVITGGLSPTAITGVPFSDTITTSSYVTPTLTESGALPIGVTFTDNHNGTATLAGTPASGSAHSYTVKVTAASTLGSTTKDLVLKVDTKPVFTSLDAATETENTAFTFTVKASGYPVPTVSETGTLPAGVTFVADSGGKGTLMGTVTTAGTWTFTFTAANSAGSITQTFTLTVVS